MAEDYLVGNNWAIVARNYRAHRLGELDIIARPPGGQILAFVEVKTRHILSNASILDHPGQQAVTTKKQRRLKHAALSYLTNSGVYAAQLRFDLFLVDVALNSRDLRELVAIQDKAALRQHCRFTHVVGVMGGF